MQAATSRQNRDLFAEIGEWIFFPFSDKLKFSIKASLAIVLTFFISFSQGWNHTSTAAITIMMIASLGTVGESVSKGALRVLGTLLGATIGLLLIAVFPQERMLYLISVSIAVTLLLYLARAYRGDTTVLFIGAMTIMIVFQDANAEDAFIYGIERTYMTIFGIVVYTTIGLFLWPVDIREQGRESAIALSEVQERFYRSGSGESEKQARLEEELFANEEKLKSFVNSFSEMHLSREQWSAIIYDYQKINERLLLQMRLSREHTVENPADYLAAYPRLEREVGRMLEALPAAWREQRQIEIPEPVELQFDIERLKSLPIMESATLTTMLRELHRLHKRLCRLAEKLNSLNSAAPTSFEIEEMPRQPIFNWFDIEDLKGTLVSFLVFWVSVLFWITFNPPGGFFLVTMATALSMMTTFSPLKPSLLIFLFSISFIFAAAAYVFILPNLHGGWELTLFLFAYTFIGYYFVNPKISIFFLLGIATLNITNDMYYNFALFLMTLFLFYMFLFILLFFYYVPFSTRPEDLFESMRHRFFALSGILLRDSGKEGFWVRLRLKYASMHLMNTVKKMQLWAAQIDTNYFSGIEKESLIAFGKSCEEMAYLLKMMSRHESAGEGKALMMRFRRHHDSSYMADLAAVYARDGVPEEKGIEREKRATRELAERIQKRLQKFIDTLGEGELRQKEFALFLESISLRKSVALAFFRVQKQMEGIPLHQLKESRF